MILNLFMILELLLTGYILFHYRKISQRYGSKSYIILFIVVLRNMINYDTLNTNILAIINIIYFLFLLYVAYTILKINQKVGDQV